VPAGALDWTHKQRGHTIGAFTRYDGFDAMHSIAADVLQRIPERWLKPCLPVLRSVSRGYRALRRTYVGLYDRRYSRRTGDWTIPPARLRDRVHGVPDVASFLTGGRQAQEGLERALQEYGRPMDSFDRVLDFGCGCGRTLRWFEPYGRSCSLHGCDIDEEAIQWCRAHLPFARFAVNRPVPPLPFESGLFDMIYAVSVFTHLDERRQFQWLAELRRVAAPAAVVLVSLHGKPSWLALGNAERGALREKGFLFFPTQSWKGIFPEWYQNAFHTPAYVKQQFSRYFDVVDYRPEGLNAFQDLVLMVNAS